jgi:Ser/Thr protein kinase RdoA (MazF antagonist)
MLSPYDLGTLQRAAPIQQGTIQTNYILETTRDRVILRYYECRSRESVLFESELLVHLAKHDYPCPRPVMNQSGGCLGEYQQKPYLILHYIDGYTREHLDNYHWRQVIGRAAELQRTTQDFRSPYTAHRWNYDQGLCLRLARAESVRLDTAVAREKLGWMERELDELDLPPSLPKGICHCDFHWSNILFQGDDLVALLDFDDANHTYSTFDLVGLIEHQAWPHERDLLDLEAAHRIAVLYEQHRPLDLMERQHLYDVYRLSILFDAIWYFERDTAADCRERKKLDALKRLGRQHFVDAVFGEQSG